MNRESLRANLSTLVAHALPKNAHQFQCSVFDDQPPRNTFGLRIDPQHAEGPVVALTEEAFVIKTGRTRFVAVDRVPATLCPAVGDKVRATPYIRRDFAGDRLDAPRQGSRQICDGQNYIHHDHRHPGWQHAAHPPPGYTSLPLLGGSGGAVGDHAHPGRPARRGQPAGGCQGPGHQDRRSGR